MKLIDTFLSAECFQLPILEGLIYLVVVWLISAAIVGLWDRMIFGCSRPG